MNDLKRRALRIIRRKLNRAGLRKKKIFAVGFNKTGTSSLYALFESLGHPSYHGVKWRSCDDLALLSYYDCFCDGIPNDLPKLDRMFPHSKFILQVRELDAWVYSRLAHIERHKAKGDFVGDLEWDNTETAVKQWIIKRNQHHLYVMSYFSSRPSDLLVVNFIRDPRAATTICRFLGYHGEYERPVRNVHRSSGPPSRHSDMFSSCLKDLGIPESERENDIYCPSLEPYSVDARLPADTNQM